MIIKLYDSNTNEKHLQQIVECLNDGGVIIYPTDTLYGFGCNILKARAIERIAKIKNIAIKENKFSIVCKDLSHLSDYSRPISNQNFKIIKRALPGPFTFIIDANNKVPKHLFRKKKQIGIRIPNNKIARLIVERLGNPILSTSVEVNDMEIEYSTDPELIYEKYGDKIDIMIDAGYGKTTPSTIVNMSGDEIEIIREGKGNLNLIY